MWGKVQCKIGKQRVAKTALTRSAGSFRGPGADLSCLRQIPAPDPRKVMVRTETCFRRGCCRSCAGFLRNWMRKKHDRRETNCEKDVKFRNHFVFNRFFIILVKSEAKDPMNLDKLEKWTEKLENWTQGCEKGAKACQNGAKGNQKGTKGSRREPKGRQKGTKGSQKGAKGAPKHDQNA
jgi:hypothetical protein